jgi:diguanylate cyclase (GGDEF)-like protein
MQNQKLKKILIVEDHHDMLMILKKYLEDQHFEIMEAETAEIGLQKCDREQPDLILMDIMLPGMSGLEAIREIKSRQRNELYIPIIIITAKNDVEDIVKGLNTGADDYVVKPFHFDELMARITTSLRLKELNEMLVTQSHQLESANAQISRLNHSLMEKNRELRKNIYNLHTLFEVSMELHSILELDHLVNSTLLTLVGQFSSKSALFLLSPKRNESRIEIFNSKGFHQKELQNFNFTKNDPIFRYFKEMPYPTQTVAIANKHPNSNAISALHSLNLEIIAPVLIQGHVEGLVCLGPRVRKRDYSQRELEQMSTLTNIISIAVSNASLYREVEQLSYTDGMTDLHNFRYFELRLKEEVVRHKRTNMGLSLLILDVDHFKNYNDTMGHPAGDEVLRKLAHILKDTVRENDIVARYGGEEFAVILPAQDNKGTRILAERLREKVENTYFEHEEIQPNGKVTVSVGASSMPKDADNYRDLILKADTALYFAKRNGRNQVGIYDAELMH